MSQLRVGYAPYSDDLNRPGDRRRFVFYARERGIDFELADPSRSYDVVVLSARADITRWARQERGDMKIVYDLIDSYLAAPRLTFKAAGRGLVKFASRETSRLALDYRRAIERMCRRADAVVCTTEEQRRQIGALCPNVHVILDSHDHLLLTQKESFKSGEPFKLVWEGLAQNLEAFGELRPVLAELQQELPIEMHLVTDLSFRRYAGRYRHQRTELVASRLFERFRLHEWTERSLAADIVDCDLAVVPLPLDDPFSAGKPENKLLLLWRLGMPTLASSTPAYARAMTAAGLPMMTCADGGEWLAALRRYAFDEQARREAGTKGRSFVERHHTEEDLLGRWDRLMETLW